MSDTQRLDKWLWHARFFKTRGLATQVIAAGHVRLNGERVAKPAQAVRPGATLTFPQGGAIRVIRVETLSTRRGPAEEARALYTDLSPPDPATGADVPQNPAFEGKGRPSAKDRRNARLFGPDPT